MAMASITVEVAYATSNEQHILELEVREGAQIKEVIHQSGILNLFPDINLASQQVGVFSTLRQLTDKVQAGDRIEIYRPLVIDPKKARRLRAQRHLPSSKP